VVCKYSRWFYGSTTAASKSLTVGGPKNGAAQQGYELVIPVLTSPAREGIDHRFEVCTSRVQTNRKSWLPALSLDSTDLVPGEMQQLT